MRLVLIARKASAARAAVAVTTLAAGVCAGLVPIGGGTLAPSASASEPRCTVIGTVRADRLVGTSGRDVICGARGDDVIVGRGGNDVLVGGAGDDDLWGGDGRDQLQGNGGADRLSGGAGSDTGTGGGGPDDLSGGGGDDRLSGDLGNDVQSGDAGDDVLSGAGGDDDLSGGSGGDDVDGGPGFNVCDEPRAAGDQQIRCVVDESAPVVGDVSLTPSTVDVSEASQLVRVEARVTDDTGVARVQIGSSADLVSGTARDGVWATTFRVPRYVTPGPRDVDVFVGDRVGRRTDRTVTDAYTVVNTVSDREMPVLRSMGLSRTEVDVRSAPRPITASVRITDDLAGATDLYLCPAHAFPQGTPRFRQAGACESMQQSSGTPTDSIWEATYVVPEGAPSGTWNFAVWVSDAAGNAPNDYWYGPDQLVALGPDPGPQDRAIPDGGGAFSVRGVAQDLNAPVLGSVRLSPSVVDTAAGGVRVTADVTGTDVEGITGAGLFIHGWAGYPDNPTWIDTVDIAWVRSFQLVSGTPRNGTWRASFVVPGGTPDGSYFISVSLDDSSHSEGWVSPDSGWTTDNQLLTPENAPTGTHFVVDNS